MPFASNERLRQILSAQTNLTDLFIIKALERILAELDVNAEDEILDSLIPQAPNTQVKMFGRWLGDYSGLNRQKIKDLFGLSDADVDAIFAALGVTQGTAIPGPLGSGPSSASGAAKAEEKPAAKKEEAKAEPKLAAKKEEKKAADDEKK